MNLVRYLQSAKNNGEDYLPLITNFNNTVKNYKIKDRDSGGIQVFNKEGNELIPAILKAPPSDPH
jgi:hypothetical protein